MQLAAATAAVPHLRAPNPLTLMAAPLPPGQPLAVRAGSAELCVGANATWWSTATLRCGDHGLCVPDMTCTASGAQRTYGCGVAGPNCRSCRCTEFWGCPKGVKPASQDPALPMCPGMPGGHSKRYKAAAKPFNASAEYPPVRLADPAAPSVLAVTEFPCAGGAPEAMERITKLFAEAATACARNPNLRLSFNVYDGAAIAGSQLQCGNGSSVALPNCTDTSLVSFVGGMKAAYWKRTIAPEVARRFEFVWLADFDISLDSLNLASFTRVMQRVGVPLMQPRIASDATYFTHLKAIETVRREYTELLGRKNRQVLLSEPATAPNFDAAVATELAAAEGCQALSTNFVEVQTPIMTSDAYAAVHELVLSAFPDGMLVDTDWGIHNVWCRVLQTHYLSGGKCVDDAQLERYDALPACAISDLAVWNHNHGVIDAVGRGTVWNHNAYAIANRTFPGCLAAPTYELATTDWGPQGEYAKPAARRSRCLLRR